LVLVDFLYEAPAGGLSPQVPHHAQVRGMGAGFYRPITTGFRIGATIPKKGWAGF
jgi:hypothetical protein